MKNVVTGVMVGVSYLGLVALALTSSPALSYYDDLHYLTLWLIVLGVILLPACVGLAALASHLRTDRLLITVGLALGFVSLAYVLSRGHPPTERAAEALMPGMYLWAAIGGAIIAWCTRPVAQVPPARWARTRWLPRPRWRRPTMIELAFAISLGCAWLIAFSVPYRLQPEFSHWAHHTAIVDSGHPWRLACVLSSLAIPCGVLLGSLGRLLSGLGRYLLVIVAPLSAALCGSFVEVLGPVTFPSWAIGVTVAAGLAIAQAGNAMSREAGSTSTTP